MMLPPIISKADLYRVYGDSQAWLPAMNQIAARHGLSGEPQRQTLGSNIVYRFGDLIVKLFPPAGKEDFHTEKVALAFIHGLTTPEIVAEGEIEGWPYFIATRLDGVPVRQVWHSLHWEQKREFMVQLGEIMRVLYDSGIPKDLRDDWETFLSQRLAGAENHHNMAEPWRSWIVEQLTDFREPPLQKVLLHGDLTPDHLLLTEEDGKWSISGLIDFGDARVGHPYYDFAIPLLDYVYGEPRLSGVLFDAYGLTQTREVLDSLTKYCLLHEFATLDDHLERFPAESPAHLYKLLWGERLE